MTIRLIRIFFCICLLHLTSISFAQTDQNIQNLVAFTKLYGYVRFFHPGDEAASTDWDRLAVYGCRKIENCKSAQELRDSLYNIFRGIAPGLGITTKSGAKQSVDALPAPPPDEKNYVIAWQHLGIFLGDSMNVYRSNRTNRPPDGALLFANYPKPGEYIEKPIGNDLEIILPLALYGSDRQTYPVSDAKVLKALRNSLRQINDSDLNVGNLYTRCADVVILWNVIQHFYPYLHLIRANWEDVLSEGLSGAYKEKDPAGFTKILKSMIARLDDAHASVNYGSAMGDDHFPAFSWERIEKKLVITNVFDSSLALRKGDIIEKVNGQDAATYYDNFTKYISSSTTQWLYHRVNTESLKGPKGSMLELEIAGKDNTAVKTRVERNVSTPIFETKMQNWDTLRLVHDSILYLNLCNITMYDVKRHFQKLQDSRVIICDMRGRPGVYPQFIEHLLTIEDTSAQWLQVPQIIYPDQQKVTYKKVGWHLKPRKPHISARVIFMVNGSCMSYAESFLSFIKHYKLATIIGEPTAGTNGNMTYVRLPGGYTVRWTGMLVFLHDGSLLHGKGILPDIPVYKTIKGVREGRDEVLEKAIEIAEKRL